MSDPDYKQVARVIASQDRRLVHAIKSTEATKDSADAGIVRAEELVSRLGVQPQHGDPAEVPRYAVLSRPRVRSWDELVAKANHDIGEAQIDVVDLLSPESVAEVERVLTAWDTEFSSLHRLRADDYVLAGVAGIFAGTADIFLVNVPKHRGFLGSKASEGGWLSAGLELRAMARMHPLPYAAPILDGLRQIGVRWWVRSSQAR